MAKKFDIGEFAKTLQVSETDTGREQLQYIDIDRIDPDPANFYAMTGLDGLASNIALLGLQQPLRVRRHPEQEGRWMVSSGHRRRAALLKLIQEDKREDLRRVPCLIDPEDVSPAWRELMLIYANSDTRKMSNADISREAEKVELLLYRLKEEGVEFPGRMRDHVAQACKVSAPKLARLKVIRENLCPDFAPDWEKGKLPEQTAYALARFPADFQQRLFRVCSPAKLNGGRLEQVLRLYEEGKRWEPCLTCPDGGTCGAKRGDAALAHDLESFNPCGGERCCLTCTQATRDWDPCERMCSKAKAQRKDKKAAEDAKKADAEKERTLTYQEATRKNARRLMAAIEAADLADSVKVPWAIDYAPESTVGFIRRFARGDFEDSGSWYGPKLEPEKLRYPLLAAKSLKCSADFLLGLTDDPKGGQTAPAAPVEFCWIDPAQEPSSGQEIIVTDDTGYVEDATYTVRSLRGSSLRWDEVTGWLPYPGTAQLPQRKSDGGCSGQMSLACWLPGGTVPFEPCEVVAIFDLGAGKPVKRIVWWDGSRYLFRAGGEQIDAQPIKWFALPKED